MCKSIQNGFCRDLKALSILLGDNAFFFGATPHALDCTVFAHLAQFLYIPIRFPQVSFLNAGIRSSELLPCFIDHSVYIQPLKSTHKIAPKRVLQVEVQF